MLELFPADLAEPMIEDDKSVLREGKQIEVEEEFRGRFYSTMKFPVFHEGKPKYLAGFTIDITDRKPAEHRNKLMLDVLGLLNRRENLSDLLRDILSLIRTTEGFDAVAIRLLDGLDFPFFEALGFPQDYLHS